MPLTAADTVAVPLRHLVKVLYLSPCSPPTAAQFCAALNARGARVWGIGDEPFDPNAEHLPLEEYVYESRADDYAALRNSVARLIERHGRFDRIVSNNEHWLEVEARLCADFDVPGLELPHLQQQRSKLGMAAIFAQAGVPYPATARVDSPTQVRKFAADHGFPLVFKPEVGSGAVNTFAVANAHELTQALQQPLEYHLVQPFVAGDIVTYDGLTDAQGRIVFATSHVYDIGIMQLRQRAEHDGYYYSLRQVPESLAVLGARAVRAFDVRERFFHIEFFARPDGSYVALEMNLRPPGGFTTDLMNYAADIDVYALWASILTGQRPQGFTYDSMFHTAHAGRRHNRTYRFNQAELQRMLGSTLAAVRPVPTTSADTMGDTAYLLRDPDLRALKAAIAIVHAI